MKYIVFGGSNGIGASIVNEFIKEKQEVIVLDISKPCIDDDSIEYYYFDVCKDSLNNLNNIFENIDGIVYTVGIGRVTPFNNIDYAEVKKLFETNVLFFIKLVEKVSNLLKTTSKFEFLTISSIAGYVASPYFSVYSATKAALAKYIEAVNGELGYEGFNNRITDVIATSFQGTSFNGKETDITILSDMSKKMINAMQKAEEKVYINEELIFSIINRYANDASKFSLESAKYKIENGRLSERKLIKVGYLSGTFDLFHVGHLNLLKNAKKYCDYLIVGVHKDASHKNKETIISFEDRVKIVESIKYVDQVIESKKEDSDVWSEYKYDFLFVGSDYKGTERFNKYEEYFSDKGVKIVYFPYTSSVSSTILRTKIEKNKP